MKRRRNARTKTPVGLLLSRGRDVQARELILNIARGTQSKEATTAAATSDSELCRRLGIVRMSLWRYFKRFDGLKEEVEAIYSEAALLEAAADARRQGLVAAAIAKREALEAETKAKWAALEADIATSQVTG